MVITNKVELKELAKRQWMFPEIGLQRLQTLNFTSQILPEVGGSRSWRKGRFKKCFEEFQAALFAYALSQLARSYRWEYSYGESQNHEYDCAIRCHLPKDDGGVVVKPVQLKELPPGALNPQATLQGLINGLTKYTAPPEEEILVVAIYINRAATISFKELRIPKLRVEQLWLYGFLDPVNCFLVGNLIANPVRADFDYPRFPLASPVEMMRATGR